MAVTLKEVAAHAGVSRSAVSRTFTEGASVSKKTRRKVEAAADALGYTPSVLASSLTTGKTRMIGLVSNNFSNPVFLQVFDLFTRGLQERGLMPLLVNLSLETEPEKSIRMAQRYGVDGVIVASSTLPPSFARTFRSAGIPVVHSFGRRTGSPETHVVGIDNEECGRIAVRTFVARGYDRVAFLGGPEHATSTQDRLTGFLQEAALHPKLAATYSFAAAYSYPAGHAEMKRLIDTGPLASAYFCGDDVLSIGALGALQEHGVAVPDDVGLLGLNDSEMAAWSSINLTTIHQPIADIIQSSLELIVGMLNDPIRSPEARIFPCRIVERGTLRPLQGLGAPAMRHQRNNGGRASTQAPSALPEPATA